jgi:hypothetical protein
MGAAGLILMAYGGMVIKTGRLLSARARTDWRSPTDAGMWFICLALCPALLSVSYFLTLRDLISPAAAWVFMAVAFASAALAIVRIRPRGSRVSESEN